jgi:cytochrome c peroxidase
MTTRTPRALGLVAWAGALWLAGGLACHKGTTSSPPSLANASLSPAFAIRDDGGGSVPVQFAVDATDPDADVTDLVITIVDGAGGAPVRLTRTLQSAPGETARSLRGTIHLPTLAVARHAVQLQALDSGGHASNVAEVGFEVRPGNAPPAIAALSPRTALAGAPAFTLTVTGSGFVATSTVLWDGAELPTTWVDAATLTAAVTADMVVAPATASVQVRTPPPGGGLSAPAAMPVVAPAPAAYDLACPPPGTGFGPLVVAPLGALPFVPLGSLREIPNPVIPRAPGTRAPVLREDLAPYVADLAAAIQLGKALYWDVQAGSDDATSCATCHHQAGADGRATNQLHPGANHAWGSRGAVAYGPNFSLAAEDFPLTDPLVSRDVDDVVGSAGVRRSRFDGVDAATGVERSTPLVDAVFGTGRQATALHAPIVHNAVFNQRNFFDGRAEAVFNGVNPFGGRDAGALVWKVADATGALAQAKVSLFGASLASQAVGPPLSPVEMSAAGRTFPDLGAKLLARKPLARQRVSPTDGVLGALADPGGKGLATSYDALVRKAFQPQWWNSGTLVTVGGRTYTLTQANFSLFWGLAVMLYEATLVSDDSPMDRYAATRAFDVATGNLVRDDPAQLDPVVARLAAEGIAIPLRGGGSRPVTRADILAGLDLFEKPLPLPTDVGLPAGTGVGCSLCHAGAETTSASVRKGSTGIDVSSRAFEKGGFDLRLERMFLGVRTAGVAAPQPPPPVPPGTDGITLDTAAYSVAVTSNKNGALLGPVRIGVYDTGWYNIGVRPTADDPALGGNGVDGLPLSIARYFQQTLPDPSILRVPGGGLGCATAGGVPVVPPSAPFASPFAGEVLLPGTTFPLLGGGLRRTEATAVDGSFKTSSLRNVELTGPYFHNGGKATLRQVVELYDAGGDFGNDALPPLIRRLGLTDDQASALVAFLVALTDERVLYERAPFDHPELPLPSGQDAMGADVVRTIPAVGAEGAAAPLTRFLGLNPFAL